MKTATQENYTGTDAIRDALKIKSHQINMNMLAHDPGRAAGDAVFVHEGVTTQLSNESRSSGRAMRLN